MRELAVVGVVGLAVAVSGCFSYRAAEPGTLVEGRDVRVQLTRLGFASLPEMGGASGPDVAGTLVSRNDERLRLRVPVGVQPGPFGEVIAQEIDIPTSDIVRYERRKLDPLRTGLVVGGGVVTAVALYLGFEKGSPPIPDQPDPPEEEGFTSRRVRIPLFSVTWR